MSSIFATAQTKVSIHWPFNQDIKGLVAGTSAWNKATAATVTSNGTDLSSKFTTSVTVGDNLNYQATITPKNAKTETTDGMMINRFKCSGTADGSNSYGVSFDVKSTDSCSTFLPTKVTATVALWYENAGQKFNLVLQKIGQDGAIGWRIHSWLRR